MKGMIFTEFLEMVEEVFSAEMVENIIDDAHLPNQGAYTDVGTYDHQEIIRLVVSLSTRSQIPTDQLLVTFGEYLFKKFVMRYQYFIEKETNLFEFLQKVDHYIHVEVKKLYPDAVLPKFDSFLTSSKQLIMTYQSNHPFSSLAEGLIKGSARHFGQTIEIGKKYLQSTAEKKYVVEFTITLCN